MTIEKICNCTSEFQDKTYGKGVRVFNISDKDGRSAKCTVCGKQISLSGGDSSKKSK